LAFGVVRCRTVAFEPDPLRAAAFERNINLNRIADLVEIRITAVRERQGIVRFSTGLDTQNHVVAEIEPSGWDVPIETLDHAFVETGHIPALIKVDVEGHEAEVLRGARAVLAAPRLKAILTENRSPSVDILERSGMPEFAYDAFAHRLVLANEVPMANARSCAILIMSQSMFQQRLRCESSGRWFNLDRRSTSAMSVRSAGRCG
jgi:FkbM family methyltransferase